MAYGSTGSRWLTAVSLILMFGGIGGLFTLVLGGGETPLRPLPRAAGTVAETAYLSREDIASAAGLDRAFSRMGYHLDAVAAGTAEVPPLFLAQVPADMDELPDADSRKAVFVKLVLPLILAVDEEIANDRARLLDLTRRRAAGQTLDGADARWLAALAQRYEVEGGDLAALAARVDVVPPSLALAQSAEESGWGTSALARRSHNLFGHTVDLGGDVASMRSFVSLFEAVRAYVHNLNTHRAYGELRRTRAAIRARGNVPDGPALVTALRHYSERGDAYVGTIRSLIRRNDFDRLDHARLGRALPGRIARAG